MNEWLDDFKMAVGFLTRLPVPHPDGAAATSFARAYRLFPVVGALIGLAMGVLCLALRQVGVPDLAAAALVLGAGALLTGALHEDGVADLADGFGGGRDIEGKLAIMRDSRIGTYGATALLVSFAAKLSALSAIPDGAVVPSLIAAHALARGVLPALALNLPYARQDGLARSSGQPDPTTTAIAGALALLIALLSLSWGEALWAAVAAAISGFVIARLALREIGGQTGDVLGAAEQVAETAILVLLAAKLT
ncbi:adenosylcobinamide-GDP ribazoletransferase [Afipia sp. GAS231]|uniref:adenosylcobinamide-GDP ribazoletransferase n=1 Tax=Afipia sp. GAS231 TaxID=1882747 RepID=UPI00087BC03F|nr:adenosylcobinamide-GDP ribazoletransferase [Afipia sp. GAS231]SDN86009.1 cobalamin-5'-phosphate synthase [Afipia sp. GAS231]